MKTIEKNMDAYEIADMLFSNKLKNTDLVDIYSDDIKTYFEMLLIIFTEGLKRFFGVDGKVNIQNLSLDDFDKVNAYLKLIKIVAKLQIFTENEWESKKDIIKQYNVITISNETKLSDLNFIVKVNKVYVINFSFINY